MRIKVEGRGIKVVANMQNFKFQLFKVLAFLAKPAQWSEDHIVVSTYPKVN